MITPTRLSYAVLAFTIVLVGVLNLGVPLLVVLFSYFALRQLYYLTKRKWLAVILFAVGVAGVAAAAAYFTRAAILALPDVADTSIPPASAWAQKRAIDCEMSPILPRALRRCWFSVFSESSRPEVSFLKLALILTVRLIG